MIKKHFARGATAALVLLAAAFGALAQTPAVTGNITTQNLAPTGTATTGSCVAIEVNNKGVATVQVAGTYTGALSGQVTINETVWATLAPTPFIPATALGTPTATIASGATGIWEVAGIAGKQMLRVCALSAVTGTATVTLNTSPATPASLATISGGAGDASASNQVAGNASLASIDGKLPALGQALAAASVPVILPSATVTTLTPPATIAVAQASTTSGQTGPIVQGAVTTSAPTYTNAQTSPLSLDTSGNLRVAVSGGAGSTISGSTAHDAAGASVNPVAIGGYASAAAPTNVSATTDIVRGWYQLSGAAVNQPSFGGVLASAGSGANGTGVQRVTIATDDTIVASLATKLDTLNTSVNASTTQLPADGTGQVAMAASFPVVIASDQSTISTNVAQINGVTTLMGAGNTGTGSQRVTIATDQAAHATHGHGATGAAVPANITAMGARAGANSVNVAQGSATVAVNVSTATTTQLVALSGSTQIYVTGLAVIAGGTGNITLVYGTGSSCGTGTTSLSGAIPLIANAGFTLGSGLGPVVVVPAGQALCITTSAAVQMSGFVTYTQF